MQITLEADYAVRIVFALAAGQRRMGGESLAKISGVTVLRKLVAAGLVTSYKGAAGGYELAKAPKEISLCDIIEAIEGPIHISRCVNKEYPCTREKDGECQFQCAFEEVSQSLRQQLESYRMDQFIRDEERKGEK